jgi:hypothetical protein
MLIAALMTGVGVGSWLVGGLQAHLPLDALYRLSSLYPILVLALARLALRSSPGAEQGLSTAVTGRRRVTPRSASSAVSP